MKPQRKSHQSSGSRFQQRPDMQTEISQYQSRVQSSAGSNNRTKQNQSLDLSQYGSAQYTSGPYKKDNNILDDINDDQQLNVNITLGRNASSDQQLQYELQRILSKTMQGQNISLTIDELNSIISAIEGCMYEAQQALNERDQEIEQLRQDSQQKDQLIHQQRSIILALQNEVSEQKHMRQLTHQSPSDQGYEDLHQKVAQLEQENEMLQIETKQALKLAVQTRNKKGEKELGEFISRVRNDKPSANKQNNYSTILNAQFNRSLHERKNSTKGASNNNKSFNLF